MVDQLSSFARRGHGAFARGGRHRGPARRPGRGPRASPARWARPITEKRELHGRQPHRPGSATSAHRSRPAVANGGPSPRRSTSRPPRARSLELKKTLQHDGRPALPPSPARVTAQYAPARGQATERRSSGGPGPRSRGCQRHVARPSPRTSTSSPANLTTQVAARIARWYQRRGDAGRTSRARISVEGPRARSPRLSDTINQMIGNLRETTQRRTPSRNWLNTNLARISGLNAGPRRRTPRDGVFLSRLIMSEISRRSSGAPARPRSSSAQFRGPATRPSCTSIASYGYNAGGQVGSPTAFNDRRGRSSGQAALEGKSNLDLRRARRTTSRSRRGLGEADAGETSSSCRSLFEEQVLAVRRARPRCGRSSEGPTQAVPRAGSGNTLGVVLNAHHRQPPHGRSCSKQVAVARRGAAIAKSGGAAEPAGGAQALQNSEARAADRSSLRASEELLQTQQEELQQTNEEAAGEGRAPEPAEPRTFEVQNAEIEKAARRSRGGRRPSSRWSSEVQVGVPRET